MIPNVSHMHELVPYVVVIMTIMGTFIWVIMMNI